MPTHTISKNGHTITVFASLWNGRETVTYDGREVSTKRSFAGLSVHTFQATEHGERVEYEINIHSGLLNLPVVVIRRNGIVHWHSS